MSCTRAPSRLQATVVLTPLHRASTERLSASSRCIPSSTHFPVPAVTFSSSGTRKVLRSPWLRVMARYAPLSSTSVAVNNASSTSPGSITAARRPGSGR